jgi:hypothetical protein
VAVTVIRMPLPKLQRFSTGAGSSEDRFLYDLRVARRSAGEPGALSRL